MRCIKRPAPSFVYFKIVTVLSISYYFSKHVLEVCCQLAMQLHSLFESSGMKLRNKVCNFGIDRRNTVNIEVNLFDKHAMYAY